MKAALAANAHTLVVGVAFIATLAAYVTLGATGHDATAVPLKDLMYLFGGGTAGIAGTAVAAQVTGK